MRSNNNQLDIFDNDPRRAAAANRVAAEEARKAYQFPLSVRTERVQHYLAEAARLEALAAQCPAKGECK